MKNRAILSAFAGILVLALPSGAGEKKGKGKRGTHPPPAVKTPEKPPENPKPPDAPPEPPKPEKKDLVEASGLPAALAGRFLADFEKKVLRDGGRFTPEQRGALLAKAGEAAGPRFAALLAPAFEGIETDPLEKAVAFLRTETGKAAAGALAEGCVLVLDRQSVWVNALAHGLAEPPEASTETRAFVESSGLLDGFVPVLERRLPPEALEGARARLCDLVGAHLATKAAVLDPKTLADATAFLRTHAGKALAGRLEQASALACEQARRSADALEREILKAAGPPPPPPPPGPPPETAPGPSTPPESTQPPPPASLPGPAPKAAP